MPFIHRRGRVFIGREGATYGTALSNATGLPGIQNGPLSGLATAAIGAQASTNGIAIPTLTREFEPQFGKRQSPAQVGRRMEDLLMVAGRRQSGGGFSGEVYPDTFGLLLLLAFGADSVAALASTTLSGAGNTANATTLTLSANSNPALADGQALFISDGANSEYVYVSGAVSSSATSVPIRAGGGTGGGLKNGHAAAIALQVGPWTHTFTPSAGSPGTWQAEDNLGGAATSLLYTGMLMDSLELAGVIENEADALQYTAKVLGKAPSATPVTASAAPSGIPLEEVAIGAGNSATLTAGGATSTTIYVPDFKFTITNTARLAKSQVSSPDPAFGIGTNFSLRGSLSTIFEDYGVYQDFANNNIWTPVVLTYTWPTSLLKANPVQAASLAITMQRFAIEKASKPVMKNDMVWFPIDNFRAEDYPDIANMTTWVLRNNIAVY